MARTPNLPAALTGTVAQTAVVEGDLVDRGLYCGHCATTHYVVGGAVRCCRCGDDHDVHGGAVYCCGCGHVHPLDGSCLVAGQPCGSFLCCVN